MIASFFSQITSERWIFVYMIIIVQFLYQNSQKPAKLLPSASIQCHCDYARSFWYSGPTKCTKSKLQISQNKPVRFTLNLHPRTHLDPNHFKTLGWLPIEQWVHQLKLNNVFGVLSTTAPKHLSEMFQIKIQMYRPGSHCLTYKVVRSLRCSRYAVSCLVSRSVIGIDTPHVKQEQKFLPLTNCFGSKDLELVSCFPTVWYIYIVTDTIYF